MASTYLSKDYASAQTNGSIATFSTWLKRGNLGSRNKIIGAYDGGAAGQYLEFYTDNTIRYHSGTGLNTTNAVFRDTSAWYHIVVLHNTGGASASDQVKIWVNGNLQSLSTNSGATVNSQIGKNSYKTVIGVEESAYSSSYYDGSMAHFHYIDGTAYDADTFGETDSTTGIWKPKTAPSVTYGTNGFFLKFENSAAFGTDSSGNSNTFTVNGTMTQTIDTPSNVFATFNTNIRSNSTFSNGNTTYNSPSSNPVFGSLTTLGASSGKYYAECKYSAGSNHYLILGIADYNFSVLGGLGSTNEDDLGKNGTTGSIAYVVNTGAYRVNNSNTSWGSAGGDGDILMMAMDCDNKKVYFGVNGTWGNSSNPSAGTGGIDVTSILTGDEWFFGVSNDTGSNETVAQFNFGNGYFGTTAVSSAQNPDDGIGIFEYDVPTGYRALCTKSINAEEYS